MYTTEKRRWGNEANKVKYKLDIHKQNLYCQILKQQVGNVDYKVKWKITKILLSVLKINLDAEGLHTLGQQCYKHLKNEYFKDEPVEYLFDGQW